jgi:hypothetical protein
MLARQEEEERLHREKFPENEVRPPERSVDTDEEEAERYVQGENYFLWKRHSPGADVDKILHLIQNGSRADQVMF